ncbi:hypothetical protein [Vreelandella nanhaiensis]|uniref:HTH psq-type domain-containing protein n=1 Tax=Vreelandella nanhaiensis TaxID=1258546 RepID=A0A433KXZ5_9GAMM|nr:hypothetical protein [Halomonas nanhaiensis]RUR34507.1 hypothetical protein ELY38_02640 [Halomonas nanhaiensis]
MTAIYTTDPKQGDSVTLSEIASRYNISISTVSRRYAQGKRGNALVGGTDVAARVAELKAAARACAARKEDVISASTRALMCPLKHIADAGKMIGGAS